MYVEAAKTALDVGIALWDKRGPLVTGIRKIKHYVKNGHVRIAVFGLGGTGKTTLGEILSGQVKTGSPGKPYQLSHKTDEFSVQGDYVCTVIVPGGQEQRILNDWPAIYRTLAAGKSRGVINVVAAGHHSFSHVNYRETRYYKALAREMDREPRRDEFIEHYLRDRRDAELAITRELIPHLKIAEGSLWMITLITKQDLWWKDRDTIRDFYTMGEYNHLIQELARSRGEQNFSHEYVSASLVMNNLQTADGEVLVPTAEGYDQTLQYANLMNFINLVNALLRR